MYIYICLPQWPDLRALLLRYWWQPLTASKPNMNIYIRLQCFKRKKTPLPNHQFDSIFECLVVNCPGCTSQTFQLSSVMALNKKIISPLPWCLFPLRFQGSPPGAFCHHGTTAQRLKRWIVGRWVELSQGAGILGESEASFGIFFLWGELPTKIHQETARDKQKTQ